MEILLCCPPPPLQRPPDSIDWVTDRHKLPHSLTGPCLGSWHLSSFFPYSEMTAALLVQWLLFLRSNPVQRTGVSEVSLLSVGFSSCTVCGVAHRPPGIFASLFLCLYMFLSCLHAFVTTVSDHTHLFVCFFPQEL